MQNINDFNQLIEFKIYDDVYLKDLNIKGYIDAITYDSYRVRIPGGYEWVRKGDINIIHANELQPDHENKNIEVNKNKTDLRYLG